MGSALMLQSFRFLKTNIWRLLAASIFLSIIFFFLFLLYCFSLFTQNSITNAEKRIDITFFFETGLPEEKIKKTISSLQKLESTNAIESFEFISKEEEEENFKLQYPDKYAFLQRYDIPNPFLDAFHIVPKEMSLGEIREYFSSGEFSGTINQDLINQNIADQQQAKKMIDSLSFFQTSIHFLFTLLVLIIAIILLLFVLITMVIYKREIFIMRLIGAPFRFIRFPFLLGSVLLILFSGMLGLILLGGTWSFGVPKVLELFQTREAQIEIAILLNNLRDLFFQSFPLFLLFVFSILFFFIFLSIEWFLRTKNLLNTKV